MPNPFDPLGLFERDRERVSRTMAAGMTGGPERPAPMSSESLWGLTRSQLHAFAWQIAEDWAKRDMIPKGDKSTVAKYLEEMANRMHGTSPPY